MYKVFFCRVVRMATRTTSHPYFLAFWVRGICQRCLHSWQGIFQKSRHLFISSLYNIHGGDIKKDSCYVESKIICYTCCVADSLCLVDALPRLHRKELRVRNASRTQTAKQSIWYFAGSHFPATKMLLPPTNINDWIEKHSECFVPPICNKLMHKKQLTIMFVGGPNQRQDFHIESGSELFLMLRGNMWGSSMLLQLACMHAIPETPPSMYLLVCLYPLWLKNKKPIVCVCAWQAAAYHRERQAKGHGDQGGRTFCAAATHSTLATAARSWLGRARDRERKSRRRNRLPAMVPRFWGSLVKRTCSCFFFYSMSWSGIV
jgi:hypothetical protein